MNNQIKLEPDFKIPLDVVYEDNDVIVLNKQAGVSVHPSINEPSGTIANALIAKYPEIKNVGDPPSPRHGGATDGQATQLRPGIVHRLDKDTSGLLVVARNQKAFEFLKKEWQSGQVVKKYLALVWGLPKSESGKIESKLARSPKEFRKRIIVKPGKNALAGKLAITNYKVIKKYESFSLVEVSPKTGRMHQIRVHMASIGHPIAGDRVYGKKKPAHHRLRRQALAGGAVPSGLTHQFLHAYYLNFSLFGRKLAFETDLPEDLKEILAKIDK